MRRSLSTQQSSQVRGFRAAANAPHLASLVPGFPSHGCGFWSLGMAVVSSLRTGPEPSSYVLHAGGRGVGWPHSFCIWNAQRVFRQHAWRRSDLHDPRRELRLLQASKTNCRNRGRDRSSSTTGVGGPPYNAARSRRCGATQRFRRSAARPVRSHYRRRPQSGLRRLPWMRC